MIDKDYCMSSFLAFRYIERNDADFFPSLRHRIPHCIPDSRKTLVKDYRDTDRELQAVFARLQGKKLGILLSGGMDSACLASYMTDCDAYTFRFLGGSYQQDELKRAELFARTNKLRLHYVDIDWEQIQKHLPAVIQSKGAPVHSIEPQIYIAAKQAKADGIECMIIGDAADYVFYGMDGLLSKDWTYDAYIQRSIYINPADVLKNPQDITYVYEPYRRGEGVDFIGFYDQKITEESYLSYQNAFAAADMDFCDPYEHLKMADPVDLQRIRSGCSKYIMRDLFASRYPDIPVPEKLPMPRPVDRYFADWKGVHRHEFRDDISIQDYTGNQKWLLFCLEYFLDMYDPE